MLRSRGMSAAAQRSLGMQLGARLQLDALSEVGVVVVLTALLTLLSNVR